MSMPEVNMRQLLEAGVHFGHHTRRWNPKMKQYIFGVRNGVHIIDLQQTVPMLEQALKMLRDVAASGGRVLFVGTKRQAQEKIKETASKTGQYYVNHRWLGGMMTNWKTITKSINRLREVDEILNGETSGYTKKELLMMSRERDKLELNIGGIKEMGGQPNVLFVLDSNKEDIAIKEANKLGIPVICVLDTNSDPDGIDLPVPGNDDALRAIDLYCDLAAAAILDGLQAELAASGVDVGASETVTEKLPEAGKAKKKAPKKAATKKADKAEAADAKSEGKDEKKSDAKKDEAAEGDAVVKKQASA